MRSFILVAMIAAALPPVAAAQTQTPEQRARQTVELLAGPDDVKLVGPIEAREVAPGKTVSFPVTLSRKESYIVYGGCEDACTSAIYTVRDAAGDELVSGYDDKGIVLPDFADGRMTIEMKVEYCYQKPTCWIAAGLFIPQ